MQKIHHELDCHAHYVKGQDKRNWAREFGIRHYAGVVVYQANGFLDKNKDVQQEMFFDILEDSQSEFVTEIVQYRVRHC